MSVLPGLFDTSIYIAALRWGDAGVLAIRRLGSGSVVWLSAVVLEELYAGCSNGSRDVVKRLERDFDGANRILVPNLTDWTRVGDILACLGATYGYEEIGRGRLTSDALIAMSAARLGVQVITTNKRDFQRLAEFRPFHWTVEKI